MTSPIGQWNTSLHSLLSHSCLFPLVCLFPYLSSWANPPPLLFYYVTYHVFYCIHLTKKTTRLFWHDLSHDSPLLSLYLLTEYFSKLLHASETELIDLWLPRPFFFYYMLLLIDFFSSHTVALRSKGLVEHPCFKTCRVSYKHFSIRNWDFFVSSYESTSPLGSPSASVVTTFTLCYYPWLYSYGDF